MPQGCGTRTYGAWSSAGTSPSQARTGSSPWPRPFCAPRCRPPGWAGTPADWAWGSLRKTWPSVDGDFDLDVFGIDSDSGWENLRPSQIRQQSRAFLAQGSISKTHFTALSQLLKQSQAKARPTLRVIVCHHSPASPGDRIGRLKLETRSCDKLLDIAADFGVAALLTGHTHDTHHHLHKRFSSARGFWHDTIELRCAATLGWPQYDDDAFGFLFHQIQPQGEHWTWNVWRGDWGHGGYVCRTAPWYSFKGDF